MTGPCITYSGKLIFPRYCTGAEQKALFRMKSRLHDAQTMRMAPMVGQKRCFSENRVGMSEVRVLYPGVTWPARSG